MDDQPRFPNNRSRNRNNTQNAQNIQEGTCQMQQGSVNVQQVQPSRPIRRNFPSIPPMNSNLATTTVTPIRRNHPTRLTSLPPPTVQTVPTAPTVANPLLRRPTVSLERQVPRTIVSKSIASGGPVNRTPRTTVAVPSTHSLRHSRVIERKVPTTHALEQMQPEDEFDDFMMQEALNMSLHHDKDQHYEDQHYEGHHYEDQHDEEFEQFLLDEAIALSLEVNNYAEEAVEAANKVTNTLPAHSHPLATQTKAHHHHGHHVSRELKMQQDREYEESLRIDREREEAAIAAAEAATKAAVAAKELAAMMERAKAEEMNKRNSLVPPILKYPIENANKADLYTIRFKLPTGGTVNHTFHKNEPLASVIQQLSFDTKSLDNFILTIQPRTVINCDGTTPIWQCGIEDRVMIIVTNA